MIRFEGVSKSFGPPGRDVVQAVDSIDLDIRKGEIVTLVGPSGCGKSTLLNLLAGIASPSAGRVLYDGRPILGLNTRTGYMTQNDHLLPWRMVWGNIAVPLEIRGASRAEIADRVGSLMRLVGLEGFEKSYPTQLSGGMRKRCALARLLAYDPETLLLDEPFAALDAQLRLMLQIELRALVQRLGKTVLFVTHDLDEAIALGDRCVVFSPRPARIRRIIAIDLPADRELVRLRFDPRYNALCAELWSLLAPDMTAEAVR